MDVEYSCVKCNQNVIYDTTEHVYGCDCFAVRPDYEDGTYPEHIPDFWRETPTVVCLCGSTRFWRTFQEASLQETLAGKIVLSIGAASGTDDEHFGNLPQDEYDRIKRDLDWLHLRKIDLADEILVLNVGGYVGESTRREIEYAEMYRLNVRYWEPLNDTP